MTIDDDLRRSVGNKPLECEEGEYIERVQRAQNRMEDSRAEYIEGLGETGFDTTHEADELSYIRRALLYVGDAIAFNAQLQVGLVTIFLPEDREDDDDDE